MSKIALFISAGRTRLIQVCLLSIVALLILTCVSLPVFAEEDKPLQEPLVGVFDQGGFLSEQEIEKITEYAKDLSQRRNIHVVVLTVAKKVGYSNSDYGSEQYAEDFYNDFVQSTPIDSSGFLFLFDMENRYMYIHTSNDMNYLVKDEACVRITDGLIEEAKNEEYFAMVVGAFNGIDYEIGDYYEAVMRRKLLTTLVGLIFTPLITCFFLVYRKRTGVTTDYKTYIDEPNCKIVYDNDTFIRQTVSVTHHSTSSSHGGGGGGGHRSGGGGGGRSGGGGGSHF